MAMVIALAILDTNFLLLHRRRCPFPRSCGKMRMTTKEDTAILTSTATITLTLTITITITATVITGIMASSTTTSNHLFVYGGGCSSSFAWPDCF